MEGYLSKYTNMISRWKKRYFILHEDVLFYCKEKGGSQKGSIHLKVARIEASNKGDSLNIHIHTGTNVIHLKAPTLTEKIQWVNALRASQQKYFQGDDEEEKVSDIAKRTSLIIDKSPVKNGSFHNSPGKKEETSDVLSNLVKAKLFSEDSAISHKLAIVWSLQAQLEETLSLFAPEAQKTGNQKLIDYGEKIQDLSEDLKKGITEAATELENSKKELLKMAEKLAKLQATQEDGRQSSLKKLVTNTPIKQNLTEDNEDEDDEEEKENKRIESMDDEFFDAEGDTFEKPKSMKDQDEDMRYTLPALRSPKEKFSVWSVLKDAIGKDLTKFCVPVFFNEPLSMLQKVAECIEYESLLSKANNESDSLIRLGYVSAFTISQYAGSYERILKPFNPILGETFEFVNKKVKFLSEQVSHHPPISAGHAESDDYIFSMHTDMKTSFWGKSLEFKPQGSMHSYLKRWKEHYASNRPSTSANNIIIGSLYIDNHGKCLTTNKQTLESCELNLKKRGWSKKTQGEITGVIKNAKGDVVYKVFGNWIESLSMKHVQTGKEILLWKVNERPENWESLYHFSLFTLQLNHFPSRLKSILPPSDSRRRPDQRALENGDLKLATSEKHRLEEKQRAARKEREKLGVEHHAVYFEEYEDDFTGEKAYKFNGEYWNDRERKDWSKLHDLF